MNFVINNFHKYQEQFLDKDSPKCKEKDLLDVADVYRNIEMPLINVVADMEDNGMSRYMENDDEEGWD